MVRKHEIDSLGRAWAALSGPQGIDRRRFIATATAAAAAAAVPGTLLAQSNGSGAAAVRFKRIPTQYIAALGHPQANAGRNAQEWGIWRQDPGPRGVRLSSYEQLVAAGGVAPAAWHFDNSDWWLEEHGLIMEQPDFPVPAGQYLVTGDREVTTVLTVEAPAADGSQHWTLGDGATVYDVTHLRCRAARYTPAGKGACTPSMARQADFPVVPGAAMPPVAGCNKQDYAVFIVIGVPA